MGDWFQEQQPCSQEGADPNTCYAEYNTAVLDPVADPARWVLKGLIILAAILCIACYKRRAFADFFVLLESLIRCTSCLFPNRRAGTEYDEFSYLITNGTIFYTLATRPGRQAIVTAFLLGF